MHSCDSDCRPFAPRQRGEGGAAAPDEGPWEVGCDRRCSGAHALLHWRLQKKPESAPHPPCRAPSPRRHGEKGQQAFTLKCSLHACDDASRPPRAAGRRDRHAPISACTAASRCVSGTRSAAVAAAVQASAEQAGLCKSPGASTPLQSLLRCRCGVTAFVELAPLPWPGQENGRDACVPAVGRCGDVAAVSAQYTSLTVL